MVDVYGIGFHTLFQLSILHLLLLVYLPIVSHHYITIINHHKPSSTILNHHYSLGVPHNQTKGTIFSAPGSCKGFLARDRLSFGNVTVEKVPFVEAEMGCSGMGEMGDGGGWGFLGILVFPFLLGY